MMCQYLAEFLVRKVRCLAYCPLVRGQDSRKLVSSAAFSPPSRYAAFPFAMGASAAGNSLPSPAPANPA